MIFPYWEPVERLCRPQSRIDRRAIIDGRQSRLYVTRLLQHGNEIAMSQLFRFSSAVRRDPAIEAWMREHAGELGAIAERWFGVMRACGDDVREILHDGHPTACVADAAFACVNAFTAHVNVGFFRGAELADTNGLLEGTGKFMRHVKLSPEKDVDVTALRKLIETAFTDMKGRLNAEKSCEHPINVSP